MAKTTHLALLRIVRVLLSDFMTSEMAAGPAVHVERLTFDYCGEKLVLQDVDLDLPRGARCLLVGGNGTGKTTFLKILAGKHLVRAPVLVLGRDAYSATPEGLTFLGSEWANNPIVRNDMRVDVLLEAVGANLYPERRDALIALLDVDLSWRMHQVSDGQRRRVQLLMGIVRPWSLLLLDEVTIDLDVCVRADFQAYLKYETETFGSTVVYATHIFDGLGDWATHVCHLSNGRVRRFGELDSLGELSELAAASAASGVNRASPLLMLIDAWLRIEIAERKALEAERRLRNEPHVPTPLEIKRDDTTRYGDRFYDYSH